MATPSGLQKSNIKINRQGGTDNFYASWSYTAAQRKKTITKKVYSSSKKKTVSTTKKLIDVIESYTVKWHYRVSRGGKWYLDKTITGLGVINSSRDLWTPPDNAVEIKVSVQPIAQTYKTNSKGSTARWFTVDPTEKIDTDYDEIPQVPSIGDVSITGKTLEAQVIANMENLDRLEDIKVRLQVIRDSKTLLRFTGSTDTTSDEKGEYYIEKYFNKDNPLPSSGIVNFTNIKLDKASSYQVRGAIASYDDGYKWSEYSDWSSSIDTRPNAPKLKSVEAIDEDKIKLKWTGINNITKYQIEYGSSDHNKYHKADDIFIDGMYQTVTVEDVTTHIVTGLSSGVKWWFRVRSVNDNDVSSASNILGTLLATQPEPPTTWSSTNVAKLASNIDDTEPVYLYWVHNTVDGSAERYAKFVFTIGGTTYYRTIENITKDDYGDLIDETSDLTMWSTAVYTDESNTNSAGNIFSIVSAKGAEKIKWKVRTRGISTEYSKFSTERIIEAYPTPSMSLTLKAGETLGELNNSNISLEESLGAFPLYVDATVTPSSQKVISWHISITNNGSYTTTDSYGNEVTLAAGTVIYSKYVDPVDTASTSNSLYQQISSADVDFKNNRNYKVTVTACTDAGLTCTKSKQFKVLWDLGAERGEEPDAVITYNEKYRYAIIRPYCASYIYDNVSIPDEYADRDPKCYCGNESNMPTNALPGDIYFDWMRMNEILVHVCESNPTGSSPTWVLGTEFYFPVVKAWYHGVRVDGESDNDIYIDVRLDNIALNSYYFNTETGDIFRCYKAGTPQKAKWERVDNCFFNSTPDTELAIYRKEPGGSFVLIADGIDNAEQSPSSGVVYLDPHPAFNLCTYRIVSRNKENGAIGYADIVENFPETSVIIQWDESWGSVADGDEVDIFEGNILELPANIKLSDSSSADVNFAEYIGRSRPVTYYGTQRGERLSISCEFDKRDEETLTLLRQLKDYMGNVYIREPSGLGYWSNVSVSYNRDYSDLTIPVTLSITPVEGGM